MEKTIEELYKIKDVNIIEMKNIIAVIAIIVLLGAIYFNENDIQNLLGKNPYMDDQTARTLDISLTVIAIIIILISVYLAYEGYILDKKQGKNSKDNELRMLAYGISVLPAIILLYVALIYFEEEKTTGTEPIV